MTAARREAPALDSGPEHGLLCDHLLLAVTGSPSALLMPQYALMLRQSLVTRLEVVMSRSAQNFLPASTMQLFAGTPVFSEGHLVGEEVVVPHVHLTRDIDLFLIMPATANMLARAAHGLCEDLISTAIVASPAPVVFVPTMNARMWRNRAVQRNVELAREIGYYVIEPGVGVQLADLEETGSMMPPLEMILDELAAIVHGSREHPCDR